ncbi:MAK10-like protein [Tanacetum coccineum]
MASIFGGFDLGADRTIVESHTEPKWYDEDMNVNISVACCIDETLRITAPIAPYNNEQIMKNGLRHWPGWCRKRAEALRCRADALGQRADEYLRKADAFGQRTKALRSVLPMLRSVRLLLDRFALGHKGSGASSSDGIDVQVDGIYSTLRRGRRTIDQSAGGKLRDLNPEESWAILEDLALYDNESWNDPRDFAKPVKAIALPQDVPSTSDRRLIELENQVQRLMEAYPASTQLTQVNKITTPCEICSGPHDTQNCMENPKQAFVEYASSRTDEAGGKWYTFKPEQNNLGDTYNPSWRSHPNLRWRQPQNSQNNFSNLPNRFQPNGSIPNRPFNNHPQNFNNQSNIEGLVSEFMASQDARLSKFEADFKQQQSDLTNKIDTVLKAITDRIAGTLPSDTIKNPKLGTHPVLSARSYLIIDPQCSSHLSTSINAIKAHFNDAIIEQQQPKEPEPTLEDKFKDLHLNLPVLEVLAHAPIYNAILDKYVESLELGKNGSAFVQGETPAKMRDPGLFTLSCRLGDSKPFDTLADLGSCVNIIPLYLFKKLNIGLLKETNHIFGLADGTKSYPVRIVKDVEVHIRKLKLLNDFYVLDMKKDPKTPLLVGRGFLATANAVIDCRMAKIAVGEGITRSVFSVKGVDLGEEEAPYWTTLGKREFYKPQPSMGEIGAKPPYYARKDFLDCYLPGEWEISKDAELNPFKDTLVFRRMVEFLGAIPINLKCNM